MSEKSLKRVITFIGNPHHKLSSQDHDRMIQAGGGGPMDLCDSQWWAYNHQRSIIDYCLAGDGSVIISDKIAGKMVAMRAEPGSILFMPFVVAKKIQLCDSGPDHKPVLVYGEESLDHVLWGDLIFEPRDFIGDVAGELLDVHTWFNQEGQAHLAVEFGQCSRSRSNEKQVTTIVVFANQDGEPKFCHQIDILSDERIAQKIQEDQQFMGAESKYRCLKFVGVIKGQDVVLDQHFVCSSMIDLVWWGGKEYAAAMNIYPDSLRCWKGKLAFVSYFTSANEYQSQCDRIFLGNERLVGYENLKKPRNGFFPDYPYWYFVLHGRHANYLVGLDGSIHEDHQGLRFGGASHPNLVAPNGPTSSLIAYFTDDASQWQISRFDHKSGERTPIFRCEAMNSVTRMGKIDPEGRFIVLVRHERVVVYDTKTDRVTAHRNFGLELPDLVVGGNDSVIGLKLFRPVGQEGPPTQLICFKYN